MKYDLIIPCAEKDYVKLPICIEKCMENLRPAPENVYIICKFPLRLAGTEVIVEDSVFEFGAADIKYKRPHWIYQQIIKLCQDFTVNDYYFCVDADIFFLKPLELFKKDKPVFHLTLPQHHEPYFNFMKEVFDLEKQVDHSFIADFTMFNKKICREFIPDARWFLEVINQCVSDDCLVGEPEIYGNYLAKHYPGSYHINKLNALMSGRYMPCFYRSEEIRDKIDTAPEDVDLIALHSWT